LVRIFQRIYRNGKPLKVERIQLPIGVSGSSRSLLDTDLVCIDTEVDDLHYPMVLLHELAHFLLNHVKETPQTYVEFLRQPLEEGVMYRIYLYRLILLCLYDPNSCHAVCDEAVSRTGPQTESAPASAVRIPA
jgi:hypothetical protein